MNIDKWEVGETMYHEDYNAYLTFIKDSSRDDWVIGIVYGQTAKESKHIAFVIVQSVKQSNNPQKQNTQTENY